MNIDAPIGPFPPQAVGNATAILGAAVGAAAGATDGALADVGIDDAFMKNLSSGTSGLFLLIRKAALDKVLEALRP